MVYLEVVLKPDIIRNFKLILEDNTTIRIPVRNGGYVNVTALCKVSNRRKDIFQFFQKVFIYTVAIFVTENTDYGIVKCRILGFRIFKILFLEFLE